MAHYFALKFLNILCLPSQTSIVPPGEIHAMASLPIERLFFFSFSFFTGGAVKKIRFIVYIIAEIETPPFPPGGLGQRRMIEIILFVASRLCSNGHGL